MTRPAMYPSALATVYDWLAANGIEEYLPDNPRLTIDGGTLTYTSYVWPVDSNRGWDLEPVEHLHLTHPRTVPLVEPMPDEVRAILADNGAEVIEVAEVNE